MTRTTTLLATILETPNLAQQIQTLPPKALANLIDRVGLEDAGEIVAYASTEQLARVFDEDLWKSERAGEDETFDAERFLVWLHVMLEAGDAFVAQKLVELPEELVILAFHRNVLVVDLDVLTPEILDADEVESNQIQKALEDCLSEEIDQYYVIARRHEGWDDLVSALLALDRDHHVFLRRVLDRCCQMSSEAIEESGGLYDVLTSEEMLENDVAGDRHDRRAEEGHVAPSDAKAFLELARTAGGPRVGEHDAVTRAYFRELSPKAVAAGPRPAARRKGRALLRLLAKNGIDETSAAADETPAAARSPETELPLAAAMRRLADAAPDAFARRNEEIAYLANVLAAGCPFQGRKLRPIEAVRAAIATVDRGLSLETKRRDPVTVLRDATADGLFRVAWAELHAGGEGALEAFLARAVLGA